MKRLEIKKLYEQISILENTEITVCGWVKSIRSSKNLAFVTLNDGSCYKSAQVVIQADLGNYNEVTKQNVGAAMVVTGKIIPTPDAKQPFEISAVDIYIEGTST